MKTTKASFISNFNSPETLKSLDLRYGQRWWEVDWVWCSHLLLTESIHSNIQKKIRQTFENYLQINSDTLWAKSQSVLAYSDAVTIEMSFERDGVFAGKCRLGISARFANECVQCDKIQQEGNLLHSAKFSASVRPAVAICSRRASERAFNGCASAIVFASTTTNFL